MEEKNVCCPFYKSEDNNTIRCGKDGVDRIMVFKQKITIESHLLYCQTIMYKTCPTFKNICEELERKGE